MDQGASDTGSSVACGKLCHVPAGCWRKGDAAKSQGICPCEDGCAPTSDGSSIEQLRALLATDGPGTVQLTGKTVVQQDVNHLSFRDLERAEMVGLPIALIVLCFAFRGYMPH